MNSVAQNQISTSEVEMLLEYDAIQLSRTRIPCWFPGYAGSPIQNKNNHVRQSFVLLDTADMVKRLMDMKI